MAFSGNGEAGRAGGETARPAERRVGRPAVGDRFAAEEQNAAMIAGWSVALDQCFEFVRRTPEQSFICHFIGGSPEEQPFGPSHGGSRLQPERHARRKAACPRVPEPPGEAARASQPEEQARTVGLPQEITWSPAVDQNEQIDFASGRRQLPGHFTGDHARSAEGGDPVSSLGSGWSDVGCWSAVWELSETGAHGNVVEGRGYVFDGANNLLRSEDALLTVVGVDDIAVIATRDSILVVPKAMAGKVTDVVALLTANGEPEAGSHREIHRPWGKYLSIDLDTRHQVKRITVKPGGVLSLQKHHHRAEHWVVVRGTAEVTRDDETIIVHENESIYLPIGCVHRMANPRRIPLDIIEVQVGSYLGEDDIIRIEDIYKRC